MTLPNWKFVESALRRTEDSSFIFEKSCAQFGGCIHQSYVIEGTDHSRFFVKTAHRDQAESLQSESLALSEIIASQSIRVPRPITTCTDSDKAYLVLEYIDLSPNGDATLQGRQLAALHQTTQSKFGWTRNNVIGSTPQPNPLTEDWIEFFRQYRLVHQFELSKTKGICYKNTDALLDALPSFFRDYQPIPTLIHGDLWAGNASFDAQGNPVFFDPAVYYGDREADIAMTLLFGGFLPSFYDAYHEMFPLAPGYRHRFQLYNLYHLLNHEYLFGGYAGQAQEIINHLAFIHR